MLLEVRAPEISDESGVASNVERLQRWYFSQQRSQVEISGCKSQFESPQGRKKRKEGYHSPIIVDTPTHQELTQGSLRPLYQPVQAPRAICIKPSLADILMVADNLPVSRNGSIAQEAVIHKVVILVLQNRSHLSPVSSLLYTSRLDQSSTPAEPSCPGKAQKGLLQLLWGLLLVKVGFTGDKVLVEEEPEAADREDVAGELEVVEKVEYPVEEFWDVER